MEGIDIIILTGLALYLVLGFRDGFFKKIFGILGFWCGLILAGKFMVSLGDILYSSLGVTKDTAYVLAFALLFVLVSVGANLSYRWFGEAGGNTLTIKSRLAGGLLGLVQGVLAVSLILAMLSVFGIPEEESRKSSALYETVAEAAPTIFDYSTEWMPDSKAFVNEVMEQFEKFRPVEE